VFSSVVAAELGAPELDWLDVQLPGAEVADLIYWPRTWFQNEKAAEVALTPEQLVYAAAQRSGRSLPGAPEVGVPFAIPARRRVLVTPQRWAFARRASLRRVELARGLRQRRRGFCGRSRSSYRLACLSLRTIDASASRRAVSALGRLGQAQWTRSSSSRSCRSSSSPVPDGPSPRPSPRRCGEREQAAYWFSGRASSVWISASRASSSLTKAGSSPFEATLPEAMLNFIRYFCFTSVSFACSSFS